MLRTRVGRLWGGEERVRERVVTYRLMSQPLWLRLLEPCCKIFCWLML